MAKPKATELKNLKQFKNVKNPILKGVFVVNNVDKIRQNIKISSGQMMLINLAKRDGVKCDCCGDDKIIFTSSKEQGLIMQSKIMHNRKRIRYTMDHDKLASLGGSNFEENMHLLCERCNSLRANYFAEYQEFKAWYDKTIAAGLNPYKQINNIVQNFCYVDFRRNFSAMTKLDHLCDTSVMPNAVKSNLMQMYCKMSKFYRPDAKQAPAVYNQTNIKVLTKYNADAWNSFLNELLTHLVNKRSKWTIKKTDIDFNVYSKFTSGNSADSLLKTITQKFNTELNMHLNVIVPQLKKDHELQLMIKHEQARLDLESSFTWWERTVLKVKGFFA